MARARPIPDLRAEGSYAEAAAKVVAVRAGELAKHAHGVLDTDDIERVHDMRVASRRLRAALEVFEPCFSKQGGFEEALSEVKALADALGDRRDRDVTIATLEDYSASVHAADRAGIESLIASTRAEQAEANDSLKPFVSPMQLASLAEKLMELVQDAERVA